MSHTCIWSSSIRLMNMSKRNCTCEVGSAIFGYVRPLRVEAGGTVHVGELGLIECQLPASLSHEVTLLRQARSCTISLHKGGSTWEWVVCGQQEDGLQWQQIITQIIIRSLVCGLRLQANLLRVWYSCGVHAVDLMNTVSMYMSQMGVEDAASCD